MNKSEILASISDRVDMNRRDVEMVIDSLFDVICEQLRDGEKVVLSGFGTFEVRNRVERSGRNPRTGEEIIVPEQKTPAFKAGKLLKDAVKDN